MAYPLLPAEPAQLTLMTAPALVALVRVVRVVLGPPLLQDEHHNPSYGAVATMQAKLVSGILGSS